MKNPWDIPINSRTVWVGIAAIGIAIFRVTFPEYELDPFTTGLILFGVATIYNRASK